MNEYRISPPLTAPLSPPFLQARTLLADSLRVRFRLGEFDPPAGQAWLRYGVDDIHTAADAAAAEDAARQALVLLLNGGRGGGAAPLPLDATASSPVAVIGPHGNDTLTLQARQKGGQRGGLHGVRWGGCRCLPCFYSEAAKAATLASISPPSPLPTAGLLRRRLLPGRPLHLLLPLHLRSHPGAAGGQRRHCGLCHRRQRLLHVAHTAAGVRAQGGEEGEGSCYSTGAAG